MAARDQEPKGAEAAEAAEAAGEEGGADLGDEEGPRWDPRLGANVASPQLNHSEGHSCYREFLPILRTLELISKSTNVPYDLCEDTTRALFSIFNKVKLALEL